ncbi:MAG: hypothetical protein R3B06_28205 [Kofleriaceae bacterium]
MGEPPAAYAGFLGTWVLIPETCVYEQGPAPRAATYRIEEDGPALRFTIAWTDAAGAAHQVVFAGRPDGIAAPFAGGDLADALTVTLVSPRDLRTTASWRGHERMVAQRQLDARGAAMRVTQLVRFDDGTHVANVAVYRRHAPS